MTQYFSAKLIIENKTDKTYANFLWLLHNSLIQFNSIFFILRLIKSGVIIKLWERIYINQNNKQNEKKKNCYWNHNVGIPIEQTLKLNSSWTQFKWKNIISWLNQYLKEKNDSDWWFVHKNSLTMEYLRKKNCDRVREWELPMIFLLESFALTIANLSIVPLVTIKLNLI